MFIKVQINVLLDSHNQDVLCIGLYFLLKKADHVCNITLTPCYQADYVPKHNMVIGKLCLPCHCTSVLVFYKEKNKVLLLV